MVQLTDNNVEFKKENATFKMKFSQVEALMGDEGFSVCVIAFANYIVNEFYKAIGKSLLNEAEQCRWLEGSGTLEFMKIGKFVQLFGNTMKIDVNFLSIAKKVTRHISQPQ